MSHFRNRDMSKLEELCIFSHKEYKILQWVYVNLHLTFQDEIACYFLDHRLGANIAAVKPSPYSRSFR